MTKIALQSLTWISYISLCNSFLIQSARNRVSSFTLEEPSFLVQNKAARCRYFQIKLISKSILLSNLHNVKKFHHPDPSLIVLRNRRRNYDLEDDDDDYDDEDEREYEYARVRRRGGRDRFADEFEDEDDFDETRARKKSRVGAFLGDEDEDDEFDLDDMVENMDFSVTIPNPILDNADPDGATDRMGELVPDRVFWRDMSIMGVLVWIWAASSPDSFVGGHDWMNI